MLLPAASRFFFLRHGETDYNRRGIRCGGEVDIPLTERGLAQAGEAAVLLSQSGFPLAWVAASPLQRVQQTARIVAAPWGLPVETCPGLGERRLGAWNGQPVADTEAALRAGETPPGGESAAAFRERILAWLALWQPRFREPGLIVASKGVGRVLGETLGGQHVPVQNCELMLFEAGADGSCSITTPWGCTPAVLEQPLFPA